VFCVLGSGIGVPSPRFVELPCPGTRRNCRVPIPISASALYKSTELDRLPLGSGSLAYGCPSPLGSRTRCVGDRGARPAASPAPAPAPVRCRYRGLDRSKAAVCPAVEERLLGSPRSLCCAAADDCGGVFKEPPIWLVAVDCERRTFWVQTVITQCSPISGGSASSRRSTRAGPYLLRNVTNPISRSCGCPPGKT
jgi:hypothetical protein